MNNNGNLGFAGQATVAFEYDQKVTKRVKRIVTNLLGVDEGRVIPRASFRDNLDADSLDLIELIMGFEEEFGGSISNEEAQTITTVGEAIAHVQRYMVED